MLAGTETISQELEALNFFKATVWTNCFVWLFVGLSFVTILEAWVFNGGRIMREYLGLCWTVLVLFWLQKGMSLGMRSGIDFIFWSLLRSVQ